MIPVTRDFRGAGHVRNRGAHVFVSGTGTMRPLPGGAPAVTGPLPVTRPGQLPYTGLDPSDPTTWTRPYNPQPGMVARLNFNGASLQGSTATGGVWKNPASWNALAGGRPARRPR